MLVDHVYHLLGEDGTEGGQGAFFVLFGSRVGVDFHGPQVGDALQRGDVMADGLLEDIGQVGRRVSGDDQSALSGVGVAHGRSAGHAGFAHAAFAGEKYELGAHYNDTPSKAAFISVTVG